MRDYPAYGALVFGAFILLGAWRVREAPEPTGALLWVVAAAAAAFATGQFFVAPRARPSLHDVQPGVAILYHQVNGFPPPSGAAAMAGAVATGMFFVHRGLAIAAAAGAAMLALFQICVIAYSWQDVAAALIFGLAIVLGGYAVLSDVLTRIGGGLIRLRGPRAKAGRTAPRPARRLFG